MGDEKNVLDRFFEEQGADLPVMIGHQEKPLSNIWSRIIQTQSGGRRRVDKYASPEDLLAAVRETIGDSRGALAVLHLGENCSGLEIAKQLRALSEDVSLALVSASCPPDEARREITKLGGDFFEVQDFTSRLKQAVDFEVDKG